MYFFRGYPSEPHTGPQQKGSISLLTTLSRLMLLQVSAAPPPYWIKLKAASDENSHGNKSSAQSAFCELAKVEMHEL